MNNELGDMKARLRGAERLLMNEGSAGVLDRVALAQAISRTRRLLRHADRARAPDPALSRSMVEVESLAGRR